MSEMVFAIAIVVKRFKVKNYCLEASWFPVSLLFWFSDHHLGTSK